jgi:hypothetical protein
MPIRKGRMSVAVSFLEAIEFSKLQQLEAEDFAH